MKHLKRLWFLAALALVWGAQVSAQAQPYEPHRPNYNQPLFPGGSYSLKVGSGTVNADYAYSLPIPAHQDADARGQGPLNLDFDPQLGQFHQGIYFFPLVQPGPAGMFDISDPMNPKPSNLVSWTWGSAYGGNGPISGQSWSHDAQVHGNDVAESADGSAVLFSALGTNLSDKVLTKFENGTGSLGGMIDVDEGSKFRATLNYGLLDPTRSWTNARGGTVTAMVSPAEGKFLLYSAGDWNGQSYGPVSIFDLSNLDGTVNPPKFVNNVNTAGPNAKAIGTIPWTNVAELQAIPSPDRSKYYLLGRVPGTASGKATIMIGEINAATGKLAVSGGVSRQKSQVISVKQAPLPQFAPGAHPAVSNLQWAIIKGTTYVFAIDDLPLKDQFSRPKALVIGVYKFDPVKLALSSLGEITMPDVTGEPLAAETAVVNPRRYTVIGSEDGSAYPIIAVPTDPLLSRYVSDAAELRFYSTKPFFKTTAVNVTAKNPDFVLKSKGQHSKAGEEVIKGVPYLGFLRTENGRTNLYVFRNVFRAAYDATGNNENPNSFLAYYDMRYGGGIRTDKIDVTGLTAAVAGKTPSDSRGTLKISFVKTLFNYSGYNWPEFSQQLLDVMVWGSGGDKFVFSGEYGGSLAADSYSGTHAVDLPLDSSAKRPGGGIWTVTEDGSKIMERDAAVDAGGSSGATPGQHGHIHTSGILQYEWSGNGGFIRGNSLWPGSGVSANRPVYYKPGTDGFPIPLGAKAPEWSMAAVLDGRAISGNKLFSLPDWTNMGAVDSAANGVGFGKFVIAPSPNSNQGKISEIGQDGSANEVMNVLDEGYSSFSLLPDNSVYPPRLVVHEVPGKVNGVQQPGGKLKYLKLTANGVVVDKTITNLPPSNNKYFPLPIYAVWGDYIIYADATSLSPGINIWKDGQLAGSVKLPSGSLNVLDGHIIAVSKNGYMAVIAFDAGRQSVAYLYKLETGNAGSAPPSIPPVVTPPIVIPPAPVTSSTCVNEYRSLCDQITQLQQNLCKLDPTLSFCKR